MFFDYDVAIIGAGPAGSTLARLLDRRLSTIIIDKKSPDGSGFTKPCGGLLAPDAQKVLSRYDITLPKNILADPQIFSVKVFDLNTGLIRSYQRFYINTERREFDMWLYSMISPGVEKVMGSCADIVPADGGFRIALRVPCGERVITARYAVGADGANSIVRRKLFREKQFRRYTAIQQWFPDQNKRPFYACIFDPETSDCCSWSISKDNFFIFGGAFFPENPLAAFKRQKEKLAPFGFRFPEPIKTEACVVLRPRSFFDFCSGGGNAFLIGEAAGFISPSSLEGISYAMESADMLAQALSSPSPNRAYDKKILKIRAKLAMKVLKCPFMYDPALRKAVMKSGLKAINVK